MHAQVDQTPMKCRRSAHQRTVADALCSGLPRPSCCCRQCLAASLPVAYSQLPMPLQVLDSGLSATGLPYSYGFAIITLTILVKVATFPLSKKQVCGAARRWSFCKPRSNKTSMSSCWCTLHTLCRVPGFWCMRLQPGGMSVVGQLLCTSSFSMSNGGQAASGTRRPL